MADEPLFIVDRIVARPGRGEELLRRYLDEYAPVARDRGLTLEHRWVSPPLWLAHDQSNTLTFVWSARGVQGYWAAEGRARFDVTSGDWWQQIEPLLVSRCRSVNSEPSDLASLADV